MLVESYLNWINEYEILSRKSLLLENILLLLSDV